MRAGRTADLASKKPFCECPAGLMRDRENTEQVFRSAQKRISAPSASRQRSQRPKVSFFRTHNRNRGSIVRLRHGCRRRESPFGLFALLREYFSYTNKLNCVFNRFGDDRFRTRNRAE